MHFSAFFLTFTGFQQSAPFVKYHQQYWHNFDLGVSKPICPKMLQWPEGLKILTKRHWHTKQHTAP